MSKAHRSGPRRTRFVVAAALGAAIGTVLLSAGCAEKSDYPAKAVKVIVPFGPGGPSDVNARLIDPASGLDAPGGVRSGCGHAPVSARMVVLALKITCQRRSKAWPVFCWSSGSASMSLKQRL